MKVSVKILQGAECNVDVVGADSVDHLKELVKVHLNICPSDQRLLHKGKTLQDGTLIQEYNLREGDKLHLVVKKESTPSESNRVVKKESTPSESKDIKRPLSGCIETQTEPLARSVLETELHKLLKPNCSNDSEVKKLVSAILKNIDRKLSSLSFDDIERICDTWNKENRLQF